MEVKSYDGNIELVIHLLLQGKPSNSFRYDIHGDVVVTRWDTALQEQHSVGFDGFLQGF